jgi:hypothetical protein
MIPNNILDIIILNNKKGTCLLVDAAISGDRNVIKKEAMKVVQYKDNTNTAHEKYEKKKISVRCPVMLFLKINMCLMVNVYVVYL